MPDQESPNFINLGVVLNDKGEVLVIRRVKEEAFKGGKLLRWAFPGGKQKFGESREEGVQREILDETGYKVKAERVIDLRMHSDAPIIAVYHLCHLLENEPVKKPSQDWEIAEVKWVKPQDLKTLFITSLNPKVAKELKIT